MEKILKEILQKENIEYKNIKKSTSGFTNIVYFVDNVVVKMSNDQETKACLEKETNIYKNLTITGIPKYIASGNYLDWQYLIISKLDGKSLYSIWHTLTQEERNFIVAEIAKIIKSFHKQGHQFLNDEFKISNWKEYIKNQLLGKVEKLEQLNVDAAVVKNFIENNLEELFKENEYSLVYNDAHFDNFLYDGKNVYLIDFDRVRYCAKDYELMIFKTMCDNPSKFASEEDDPNVNDCDYENVYIIFKQTYPELYNDLTEKRVKVYQFNYLIGQATNIKNFEWIQQLLKDFECFVNTL